MLGSPSSNTLRRWRPPWRSPVGPLVLAGLSVLLGVIGYGRVTAIPTEHITFVIEDDLPHGITAESVEHVMQSRDLTVFEPFTFHVTDRELEWSEYHHGELAQADIMLSVGDDEDDRDLGLQDSRRVAFRGEETGSENRQIATEIRASFINNRTLGHGPSAVVGAAMTAADMKYPGPNRSLAWWMALAALPVLGAFWVMTLWLQDRRRERGWQRRYRRARWQLAQTVLELDALEVRYETAQNPELAPMWRGIRSDSLVLAQTDQKLESRYLDNKYVPPNARSHHENALVAFEQEAASLIHRADALAGSAEVHAGHVGSRSVLDRIAKPVIQAVDELLARRRHFPDLADQLTSQRERLLALSQQASQDEDADADQLKRDYQQVLDDWREVEDDIRATAGRLETHIRTEKVGMIEYRESEATLKRVADQRLSHRIAAITAGQSESLARLRRALGLGHGAHSGPGVALERVLEVLDTQQIRSTAVTDQTSDSGTSKNVKNGAAIGLLAPLAAGLIGGGIAVGSASENTAYGRQLTGDQHLQDLSIYGDLDLLPTLEGQSRALEREDDATNTDLLTLEYVHDRMQSSADHQVEGGLLPDDLELTLAIVPIDDYTDYGFDPDFEDRLEIDYDDILVANQQLKDDVSRQHPELLDPVTGEIALGQALQPIWVLDDGTYATGGIMTGEISWGIDSRLGTYYFTFTEPGIVGKADDPLLTVDYVAYDLQTLARNMEYNHQHAANHDPAALFWTVALAVWAAVQTLLFLGVALVETSRRFESTHRTRQQLAELEGQLEQSAIGLDMSRLDMVAVLGAQTVSSTGGDAEMADQRLYEATLVTAWRQVQDLQTTPRREQRGEAWTKRVQQVQRLVDIMATRELTVSQRAAAVLQDT